MTAMMKTVIISGTGRAADIGKPAAGKTGTTDDYKDAYFVGYTPDVVTGVWVGDDNNKRINGLYGGTVPAKIWKDVMTVATRDYGKHDFDGYPEINLANYAGAKVVGEDEETEEVTEEASKDENENKEQEQGEEAQTSSTAKPAAKETAAPEPKKTQTAPVPSSSNNAPIPMAIPESLR